MKRLLLSVAAVAAGLVNEPAQACSRLWHRSDCRCDQRPAAQVYETPPQVERYKVGEIFEERVIHQRVTQWETRRQIVIPEAGAVPPAPKVQRQLAPPVQPAPAPVPLKPQPQSPSPRERPAPAESPTAVVWSARGDEGRYCFGCGCVHAVGHCLKRVATVVVGTTLDIGGTAVDVVGATVGTTIHAGGAIVTGATDRVVGLFDRTRERFGDRTRRDPRLDFPDCRN